MTVAPSGPASIRSVPPTCSTRSRIEAMPTPGVHAPAERSRSRTVA
ncbi:hypothetical protein KZZ52_28490 [Dactylosporangium sp. AC04546]|nr:hypothetical protein [Dactylosporangium sp. AC04546]WVK89209.1 hypothetical protein KZZ52_28490 [Dactylosporangium sp. AC04546]